MTTLYPYHHLIEASDANTVIVVYGALFDGDAAAGPDYTLAADQGAHALTGQAAGLIVARQLTADQGSFSLGGQTAGLLAARQLAAGQGSFSLGGQAADLSTTSPQTARPDEDVSIGSWTTGTGSTSNLFAAIDETSASDADYIRSANDPINSDCEIGLLSLSDPESSSDHVVSYRYGKGETGGGSPGVINITVSLIQGTTVIASNTHSGVTTTVAAGTFTLSGTEADSITDYADLRLRFRAHKASGARTSWGVITWAEVEVPPAAAAGPTYTLTADQGSLALSGQAAALTAARQLTADVGSLSLAGQIAALSYTRMIAADQAAFSLSGQAAGLLATRQVTADVGAFSLSGQLAGVIAARLLTAEDGTLALSGQDAELLLGQTLTADGGSFAVTGQDVGLLAERLLAAEQASYTLAGQDADLSHISGFELTAEVGSFSLSGQAAGITAARQLTAEDGAYALSGQDADLIAGRTLALDVGAFTLTGQTTDLLANRLLAADQASYTLSGQDAQFTVMAGYELAADAGAFSLSGQAAGLTAARELTAEDAAFALSGQPADLLAGRTLALDAASFTLAGQDAGLLAERLLAAASASFSVSGIDAELRLIVCSEPISPTSVSQEAFGLGPDWQNIDNITAEDGAVADTVVDLPQGAVNSSDFLIPAWSAAAIAAELPASATLTGLRLVIRRRTTGDLQADALAWMRFEGTPYLDGAQADPAWTSSFADAVLGGPTELWDTGLETADLRSSGLEALIFATRTAGTGKPEVDHVELVLCYEATLVVTASVYVPVHAASSGSVTVSAASGAYATVEAAAAAYVPVKLIGTDYNP